MRAGDEGSARETPSTALCAHSTTWPGHAPSKFCSPVCSSLSATGKHLRADGHSPKSARCVEGCSSCSRRDRAAGAPPEHGQSTGPSGLGSRQCAAHLCHKVAHLVSRCKMVVVSCFQKNSASATGACVAVRAPTAGRPVQALNGVGHIIGKGSDPLRVLAAGQLDDDDVERRAQGKLLAPATTFLSEYRRHTPSAGRPWSSPASRNLSGEPSGALEQVAIKLHEDRACAECTCRRSHYMRS